MNTRANTNTLRTVVLTNDEIVIIRRALGYLKQDYDDLKNCPDVLPEYARHCEDAMKTCDSLREMLKQAL